MPKVRATTTDLIAPGQIGWVFFQEGPIEIAAKVIRGDRDRKPYIAIPTAYRRGVEVPIVTYLQSEHWVDKRTMLLEEFRQIVGEHYFWQTPGL